MEAALLNGIVGVALAGTEGEDEDASLFVGTFLRFTPETLPTFSAGGRADRAVAAAPGARAFPARPSEFPPYMTMLFCRLRAGAVVP